MIFCFNCDKITRKTLANIEYIKANLAQNCVRYCEGIGMEFVVKSPILGFEHIQKMKLEKISKFKTVLFLKKIKFLFLFFSYLYVYIIL